MNDTTKILTLSTAGLLATPLIVDKVLLNPEGKKDKDKVIAATAGTGAVMGLGISLLTGHGILPGLLIGAAVGGAFALSGGLFYVGLVESPILDKFQSLAPSGNSKPAVV